MKLSRILGLLAVLLVLPITLALKGGISVASAQCQATVGDCCFEFGSICEANPDQKLYDYVYSPTGCGKP